MTKHYIPILKKFIEFENGEKEVCPECGQYLIDDGSLHTCPDSEIKTKAGDGSPEYQRKAFANDILQPNFKNGKVNDKFIKVYGKEKHPDKKIAKSIKL